jgi:flagellar biosynthetic protein FlhB
MADEDDASKTEDPTERKLSKARDKGQVAVSQEVKSWVILLGGTMAMITMAPGIMGDIRRTAAKFIHSPEAIPFDFRHLRFMVAELMGDVALIMAPLMGLLVVLAMVGSIVQTGFLFAPEKIKPDPSKVSLVQGTKRRFSLLTLVEFVKGILKISVVALVAFGLAIPLLGDLPVIPLIDIRDTLGRIHWIAFWLMVGTVSVMTVIAVLDFAYQKYAHLKKMRMSKQEVKDEHRQSEGDPHVKARIRKIRTERAQQRMMAAVPEADVVITNPTHYAVALSYEMDSMAAPKLVAKGMDSLAQRIRSVAEENEVPVVENPPLARALYATVELDEEIPDEHYKAVAEIIGYVMRLRGDLPGEPAGVS